ncbi:protein mono-ADP-ribosyltransferase PARP12-like [Macrobrachium nipponense]|uniref:protein mono-ADP-ribosyltransferase PARP12-like n=1 Tax=Macrobrachium nipponense TaxID=159736 RepID=UPI0030C86459
MGNSSSRQPESPNDNSNTSNVVVQPPSSSHHTSGVHLRTNSSVSYTSTSSVKPAGTTSLHRVTPTPLPNPPVYVSQVTPPVLANPPGNFLAPRSTSSPTVTSPVTRPLVGHQSVVHSVNNYLISASKSSNNDVHLVTVPFGNIIDKFCLHVCPQYNSKEGCRAPLCRRIHVCYYWILDKCSNSVCAYDHSIDAFQNIFGTLRGRRNVNTSPVEVLRDNHRFNRNSKRKNDACVCMFYLMGKCKQNDCSHVHSKKSYVWEVKKDETWLRLSYQQSDALEELFCQPDQEVVDLLPIPRIKSMQALTMALKQNLKWKADFQAMKVYSGHVSYELRRLSTASDICSFKSMHRVATRWIWYWQSSDTVWIPYKDGIPCKSGITKNFYNIALSDQLEHHYNFSEENNIEIIVGNYTYTIDMNTMTQTNKSLGTERKVRRRPVYNWVKNKDLYFDQFFTSASVEHDVERHDVPMTSPEFSLVKSLMEASMNKVCILSVERIINKTQWKVYQNKKALLKHLYQDNQSLINEQFLFHGTRHSVVDQICKDNFDWRLHGTNVGRVYGQGLYFSNHASISNSYSETDSSGMKCMFIALVLVGSMTVGNSSMKVPPVYDKTNSQFNTSCDTEYNARIFVKYHRDEYYPAYIVWFQT